MSSTSVKQSRATAIRLSVPVVLGAIVVVSAGLHAAVALSVSSPWIVPDELIYSELAKSLGEGGLPRIRDEVSFAYGLGYPALLAPVWAAFDDVATAYAVAKVLNALVLSLTAVPAYFLARRFVTSSYALVVAALAVSVPSMLYAGTLMTEVAFYPTFVLALLGIAYALERPTLATQAAALGAIALASAVKMLAAVLVVTYVVAIVLYQWLESRDRSHLRKRLTAYAPTWFLLAGLGAAAISASALLSRSPLGVLGAYSVVLDNVDLIFVPWWAFVHIAELDLYLAVIPFAATSLAVIRGFQSRAEPTTRLFAALVIPVTGGLVLAVATYSSEPHAAHDPECGGSAGSDF